MVGVMLLSGVFDQSRKARPRARLRSRMRHRKFQHGSFSPTGQANLPELRMVVEPEIASSGSSLARLLARAWLIACRSF